MRWWSQAEHLRFTIILTSIAVQHHAATGVTNPMAETLLVPRSSIRSSASARTWSSSRWSLTIRICFFAAHSREAPSIDISRVCNRPRNFIVIHHFGRFFEWGYETGWPTISTANMTPIRSHGWGVRSVQLSIGRRRFVEYHEPVGSGHTSGHRSLGLELSCLFRR